MIDGGLDQAQVLQLLVTLGGPDQPPVWRRVLVPADMRLDRLHDVIQAAMGWSDSQPHTFSSSAADYGPADPERDHLDERDATIGELLGEPGEGISYAYGPGRHAVVLEELLPHDPAELYPACLSGAGRCPPERDRPPADRGEAPSEAGGFDLEQAREALAFLSAVP